MSLDPGRLVLPTPVAFSRIDDRFQVIFDSVNDGIFVTDPLTGCFIEVNDSGCAMFGYDKAELLGESLDILASGVHPHTSRGAIDRHAKAMAGVPQIFEWHGRSKNGALFWSEISIRYTEFGHIPAIVAIVRDISERKRLVSELTEALEDATAASDAKSAFLATMSHELRTPLNAIIGFSDFILSGVLGPLANPRYRDYINDIHVSGQHLLALINDVLDLSRLNAGMASLHEEEISLCHVIKEARSMVAELAESSGIHIVTQVPAGLPGLRGDQRRIKQILLNLLSNAIKFTLPTGTVTICAGVTPDGLLLEIRDTGIGIADADMPMIFEQFRQVDSQISRQYAGTGLGLPLAKRLVELHGGIIHVQSAVHVGTCVAVTFPAERLIKSR